MQAKILSKFDSLFIYQISITNLHDKFFP